jgi:hypothetical protein
LLVPPPDYHVGFRLYENDRNTHARVDAALALTAFGAEPASVPLPGTLGLFALGLGALGLAQRRARRV